MSRGVLSLEVTFTVNGSARTVRVHPLRRLLDVLREELGLTGAKEGCGEGECGACAVLLDDLLVLSCLVPACQLEGARVVTIEGITPTQGLDPLQQAFLEKGGAQCGICTPGMILAARHYLEHPERARDWGEALAGNQCRCTGYQAILKAVHSLPPEVK